MNKQTEESIKEHLSKLPEDNQQAINSIDWLKECQEIGKKYNLIESEIAGLEAEVALFLVGLSDLKTLHKYIDNEIGGTGWQEIEKEVHENILLPIAEKLEEISPSKQSYTKNNGEFFNDGSTIVTAATIKHHAQSYPIRTIVKVSDFKMPPEIQNFIINGVVAVLGFVGLFTFKTMWVVIGLIGIAVGGFNCYNIIKVPHYIVIVEFSNGEKLDFDFPEIEKAVALRDAINEVLRLNR